MRILILIFWIITITIGCKKDDNDTLKSDTYKVQYNIGCTDCMVVYIADSLGTQQTEYNQNSSWSYVFFGKKEQEVLLLAYNTANAPQGVNVKIAVNDSTIKDKTTYCAISGVSFVADTIR